MIEDHIIIDGYNVIFRDPALRELGRSDLERARSELLRRLAEAFPGHAPLLVVVFDGARGAEPSGVRARLGRVRVVFSRPPESADERIHRLIEEARRVSTGRRQLAFRVVSSDREVAGRARLWGARSVGVEEFLRAVEERRRVAAQSRAVAESAERRARPGGAQRAAPGGAGPAGAAAGDAAAGGAAGERKPELHAPGEIDAWEKIFRLGRKRQDEDDDGPP
jgi:predicted RNA-binding protein with PIN domain